MMNPEQYASHAYNVKTTIGVYFDAHPINLKNLSAAVLDDFYEHERLENKVSTKSLLKLHETVITSLSHAVEQGWIEENPAECVNPCVKDSQILFTAFLQNWLKMMKTTVKLTTYSGYAQAINNKIVPYFDEHYPGLRLTEVTAQHIQDYYTHEILDNGLSANTVKHRHANIRKALQYAYTIDLIPGNPAAKVELPKIEKYVGTYYNATQIDQMFKIFKGDPGRSPLF